MQTKFRNNAKGYDIHSHLFEQNTEWSLGQVRVSVVAVVSGESGNLIFLQNHIFLIQSKRKTELWTSYVH